MLVGLVRDSFLKCFCQTCSVNSAITSRRQMSKKPITKKNNKKPRCKQPKKARRYHAATEIRCEEKSRGGMCYEVILADKVTDKPPASPDTIAASPKPKPTVQDINLRLLQAEERRKSMEVSRLASLADRLARLEEASKKRDNANEVFVEATKVALKEKLDSSVQNREAYLNGLRTKISEHCKYVAGIRKQIDTQSDELKESISDKLVTAQENRDENLKKMLEKLKEHEDHSQKVRLSHEEAVQQLEKKITSKLDTAKTNRETEMLKKLESLRQHSEKIVEAKETLKKNQEEIIKKSEHDMAIYNEKMEKLSLEREIKQQEICKTIKEKLDHAQDIRNKEDQKLRKEAEEKLKQKLISAEKRKNELALEAKKTKEEQDRRAELVRANKERLMAAENLETASSG